MEPITLILGALAAGALAGVKDSATGAVKDAYAGLKRLVATHFAGKPAAELALAEHAADPDTWQAPLAKALAETGTDADPAVIEAARRLMELVMVLNDSPRTPNWSLRSMATRCEKFPSCTNCVARYSSETVPVMARANTMPIISAANSMTRKTAARS